MSVCGYPPRDFLEFEDFLNRCYASVEEIKTHTSGIGVIVGSPAPDNRSPKGKICTTHAWFLHDKEVKSVVYKTCLPTYDIFDEYRYFETGSEWHVFLFMANG